MLRRKIATPTMWHWPLGTLEEQNTWYDRAAAAVFGLAALDAGLALGMLFVRLFVH